MQTGYKKLGSWKNVPIFVHWSVLLWLPLAALNAQSFAWALLSFPAFFILLLAHELGHAYVAGKKRVWVLAVRLYLLYGLCEHEPPYYEKDDVLIAWGGVLAQLAILAMAIAAKLGLLTLAPSLYSFVQPLFFTFIEVNIAIIILNLLPIPPLDGQRAWRAIPLLRERYMPTAKKKFRRIGDRLNVRKRRAMAKESERVAADLIDRLRRK